MHAGLTAWPIRVLAAACSLVCAVPAAQALVTCTVTAVGVNFGVYDPAMPSDGTTTGSVTVTCNHVQPGGVEDVTYVLTLSRGSGGTFLPRQLLAGTQPLAYNLYDSTAGARVWGDGSSGTVTISGTLRVGPGVGNGTRSRTHTIYGIVPALQDAPPGNYLDTIVVSLTY